MSPARRIPVAVVEPAAAYRRGLEAALRDDGFDPQQPADVRAWAADGGRRAIVIARRSDADAALTAELTTIAEAVVIALVPGGAKGGFLEAIQSGCDGVADWDEQPENIVAVLSAALESSYLIPHDIGAYLARGRVAGAHPPHLSDEELQWLRALADGSTVTKLADDVGYSERAMFRKLHDLYVRLGVKSRSEALVAAQRMGLLD